MALVTTTLRPTVTRSMAWIVATLLVVCGSWLIGQGVWIHIKAVAAQWLLQRAWQETLTTHQPVKPWPWADTWPAGRLVVPRLAINQIILADASGESLAFGPGIVSNRTYVDEDSSHVVLSGHRDTHFSFLRDLQGGEAIRMQTLDGHWRDFVADTMDVVDSRIDTLQRNQEGALLQLITCYPFDSLIPGGPLRYVITAKPMRPKAFSQVVTSANAGGGLRGRGMMVEGG